MKYELEIYPISKYEQKKSRSKKKKESRKEQKNLNDKNARKNLITFQRILEERKDGVNLKI